MYTEFKFDIDEIRSTLAEAKANLQKRRGGVDFVQNAVRIYKDRLSKDVFRYRDYGPYWPALKNILIDHGVTRYGGAVYPDIAAEYRGENDAETIMMAEEFREWYLESCFIGFNRYQLTDSVDEEWVLIDSEAEKA